MGVSKNRGGKPPQIIHLFIGFSIIFTIHFGGFPLFLETPISGWPLVKEGMNRFISSFPYGRPASSRFVCLLSVSAVNFLLSFTILFHKVDPYQI